MKFGDDFDFRDGATSRIHRPMPRIASQAEQAPEVEQAPEPPTIDELIERQRVSRYERHADLQARRDAALWELEAIDREALIP